MWTTVYQATSDYLKRPLKVGLCTSRISRKTEQLVVKREGASAPQVHALDGICVCAAVALYTPSLVAAGTGVEC